MSPRAPWEHSSGKRESCSLQQRFPSLEGQMGNKAQETQQAEATWRWRDDQLPREKEQLQPLKAVKPINSTATVD